MNKMRATCLGFLLASTAGLSANASANTVRYEGDYVMASDCQFSITAGMGFVTMSASASDEEITADSVDNLVQKTFQYTCDGVIIDGSEVESYQQAVAEVCSGFVIPGVTQTQRDQYCGEVTTGALDFLSNASAYALREMVDSVSVNIVNDYWIGGFGEMDYLFASGATEYRGPNVFVSNAGKYYRGFSHDGDLPNPFPYVCHDQIVGKMDTNIDRSSAFGGGARMYLDTNIVDGVACPILTLDGEIVVAGYGYVINIAQKGDRQ